MNLNNIEITEQFKELFDLLENKNENIILFGSAGTGKSTFLEWFRKNTKKNVVVLAPTGIAALNVKGQTIHSMFRFPFKPLTPIDIETLARGKKDVLKHADIIVIDEISMVKADILDAINWSLQINLCSKKMFAGKQILLMGDIFQLPPVVTNDVAFFYKQFYESPYFFSSQVFKNMDIKGYQFNKIFRQNDKNFINKLNEIRFAKANINTIKYFNERNLDCKEDNILTITSYSNSADLINSLELEKINSEEKIFTGYTWGKFKWDKSKMLTPMELKLKVGAQVIFTKNEENELYKNGMIGKVVGFKPDTILVEVDKQIIYVTKTEWKTFDLSWNENENRFNEIETGGFCQFPLALGFAVTIHKSQAQTYDKVKIDLGRGAFAPGQLYVALSRCKDYNKIYLTKPIKFSDIIVDNVLMNWWNNHKEKILVGKQNAE
ncbi:MAG: DEAD/DEAH box helicase [Staphylococcus sp.]|nr:DEAD/DEAH box helicase [Staphylococcus sp.]